MTGTVAVLLATYDGEKYIKEQLDSILAQTHTDWTILVSDDGSSDRTLNLISDFEASTDRNIKTLRGPGRGFVQNFLHLLREAGDSHNFYAFADQDDKWHADKLSRALAWLSTQPKNLPLLYCSRTRLIDADGAIVGQSPLFNRQPSFHNALVQSIAGGNTMVMNRAARRLLVTAGSDLDVPGHDWWSYILVTGAGGRVQYDPKPTVDYRQHGANLIGATASLHARLTRLRNGRIRAWSDANISALESCISLLNRESRETLNLFKEARSRPFPSNLMALQKGRFYRQTLVGDVGLVVAVLSRKI